MAFNSSRAVARDGRRKADLEATRSALELYRSDVGAYPASLGLCLQIIFLPHLQILIPRRAVIATRPLVVLFVLLSLCARASNWGAVVSGCGSCGVTCNYKTTNP